MKLRIALAALAGAALMSSAAQAATIFAQNFNSGTLGANESVGGIFAVKNGQMGHVDGTRNNDYSYYDLTLDLANYTDALLRFDFSIDSEWSYDGFNVIAATGAFSPPNGLLTPSEGAWGTMSNNLSNLGKKAISGKQDGALLFDLTQFAGQTVNLRFQYQSDWGAQGRGVLFDNILATGTAIPGAGAVPEPATWAMLIFGFFGSGAMLRQSRRRNGLAQARA